MDQKIEAKRLLEEVLSSNLSKEEALIASNLLKVRIFLEMIRIALGVEYDGSRFYGFQRQKYEGTIQGHLERAISKVADHSIKSYCSGRTDAGVHAFMQVIHFDSNATRTQQRMVKGCEFLLTKRYKNCMV